VGDLGVAGKGLRVKRGCSVLFFDSIDRKALGKRYYRQFRMRYYDGPNNKIRIFLKE
jgi:hypothetical protein